MIKKNYLHHDIKKKNVANIFFPLSVVWEACMYAHCDPAEGTTPKGSKLTERKYKHNIS
jgi:hypothetical protein